MKSLFTLIAILCIPASALFSGIEHEGVFGAAFVGVSTDSSSRIVNQVGPLADFAVPRNLAAHAQKRTLHSGESSILKADLVLDDGTVTRLPASEVIWTSPASSVAIENGLATAVAVSKRMSVSMQASAHGFTVTFFIRLKPGENASSALVNAGLPSALSDSIDLGQSGWKRSSWFGSFFRGNENWLHHQNHGWLYSVAADENSLWLWNPQHRWLWSSRAIYPHIYRNKDGTWLYFMATSDSSTNYYNQSTKAFEPINPLR